MALLDAVLSLQSIQNPIFASEIHQVMQCAQLVAKDCTNKSYCELLAAMSEQAPEPDENFRVGKLYLNIIDYYKIYTGLSVNLPNIQVTPQTQPQLYSLPCNETFRFGVTFATQTLEQISDDICSLIQQCLLSSNESAIQKFYHLCWQFTTSWSQLIEVYEPGYNSRISPLKQPYRLLHIPPQKLWNLIIQSVLQMHNKPVGFISIQKIKQHNRSRKHKKRNNNSNKRKDKSDKREIDDDSEEEIELDSDDDDGDDKFMYQLMNVGPLAPFQWIVNDNTFDNFKTNTYWNKAVLKLMNIWLAKNAADLMVNENEDDDIEITTGNNNDNNNNNTNNDVEMKTNNNEWKLKHWNFDEPISFKYIDCHLKILDIINEFGREELENKIGEFDLVTRILDGWSIESVDIRELNEIMRVCDEALSVPVQYKYINQVCLLKFDTDHSIVYTFG